MGPMDITVSTTVVVTVSATLHVTKKLVTVTGGVTRDILTVTAGKVRFTNKCINIFVLC